MALRVGLAHVQRRWPGPLALAEAGASAGLNLLFDRYRYRLGGDEPTSAASQVVIGCELRGDAPAGRVLGAIPEVTSRLGIDREPVDLADPAARAWLEAFIWPERTDDLATLRAAIDVARPAPAGRRPAAGRLGVRGGTRPGGNDEPHRARAGGPLAQRNTLYLVGASLRGPGSGRDDRLLALADPYLRWLAPARTSTDDFAWVG